MKRRFVLEWCGLTISIALIVPALMFLATVIRVELVGDKPSETGADLEWVMHLQWAVQLASYLIGVGLFSLLALVILKRK